MGLHRFTLLVAGLTFLLLIVGGLVTSTGSGLAVPDWPLSYGQFFPPMQGGVLYEHGHRMLAGVVGVLMVILALWLWMKEPRPWVRRVGTAALSLVVVQALLGGLTVLFLLPPTVSIAHACVGPTIFCLTVCLALATSPDSKNPPFADPLSSDTTHRLLDLQRLSVLTTAFLYLQLVLGAVLRHTQAGLIPHLVGAALVVLHVGFLIVRALKVSETSRRLLRPAGWLGGLFLLQLILGGGALFTTMGKQTLNHPMAARVLLTTAHMAVGTLMLATALVLVFRTSQLAARIKQGGHEGLSRGDARFASSLHGALAVTDDPVKL
ncbi:MAG: COX15/CtaA family protein [Elusimicrobia bacterium]|nr:COX15/CtaA family protein [Elusimicrobiota bacterium]